MQKPKAPREFLYHLNKMKIFTLNHLYDFFEAKSKKQQQGIKNALNNLIKKGYVQKKTGGVYMPVFKRDKSQYGVIGYENPRKDFSIICQRFEIKPSFSSGAIKEAEEVAHIPEKELENRTDYRNDMVFTIDGADAKDLDDAISLKQEGKNTRLYVHIADVSFYVREKSKLDQEAFQRGTSIYLVDTVVPMLPKVISNGICSLHPGEPKLTLSAEILLSPEGEILEYDFFPGVINSIRRFTYHEVESILETEKPLKEGDEKLVPILKSMEKLARTLRKKRFSEGALDFDIPETKIICDNKSRPIEIHPVQRLFSHQLIEEFMLTANKTVALYLDKCGQGMYRVHEEPDEEKIQHFINMANIVGYKLKSFPDSVALQSFLDQLKGKPESYLLNTLLLRSMKQAYYHHENMGHFGLSFSHYTHFTSPIRRYPDLVVHRLIKKFKKMDRSIKEAANPKFLKEASEKSSATERVAVEMERAMQKRKAIHYLRDHVGKAFYGVVSGVIESGIFVALNDLGIEGMVVNTLLEGYEYNEDFREFKKEKTVIGTGTQVKIRLISLNLKRELIDFQLLDVISQKGSA